MPDESLHERLSNHARPVFLLGDVPPGEGTPPHKCSEIANKFVSRSRMLAADGYIVYDIQDEPGRTDDERPFPFRRVMDSSTHAALLSNLSGRECLVYKCVADPNFEGWLETNKTNGHAAINLVGRASSEGTYEGPTISEAMSIVESKKDVHFGCVCIAERHTLEAAQQRGKPYPTEHLNMVRKMKAGAKWFISQAVYDPLPTIRLLKDYATMCKQKGIVPRKVILTFAPVSRKKTMNFIKWLGVRVPAETEELILSAEKPIERSIEYLCDVLREILSECSGIGVPLGISCESVSIFKSEIDGVHELFRRLQTILLDSRGSPWKVQWLEVMPPAGQIEDDNEGDNAALIKFDPSERVRTLLLGIAVGAATVSLGAIIGGKGKHM